MPLTVLVAAIAALYAIGALRLGRRSRRLKATAFLRAGAMGGALLVLYIALASVLDEWAGHLLVAHMIQHLALMLLVAPLFILARPRSLIWCTPQRLRRRTCRLWNRLRHARSVQALREPALSWSLFCGAVLFWHVPAIYRWALRGDFNHGVMNLSFILAALLFWSVVIAPGGRRPMSYAGTALYVFFAALVTGLPGALIAFARTPLYWPAAGHTNGLGLTTLEDQQIAGLIMWIPMDLILFAVALALFAAALGTDGLQKTPNGTAETRNAVAYPRAAASEGAGLSRGA
jgi:cytochrome c oxidase assembly factor CtaG